MKLTPSSTVSRRTEVAPPQDAAAPPSSIVGRLAEEMVRRWQAGGRPRAEEFIDRHPSLWGRPNDALELIAEELALREEFDRPVSPDELAERFPQWRAQVLALSECQRTLRTGSACFPTVGDRLGGFLLVAELGRGANGRVFLATQTDLGERPVVLKLAPSAGGEHLCLARLQHSHIVPLYSAHEFPEFGLRGLCLPYFGGVTLAAALRALADRPPATRSGRDLLRALREAPVLNAVPVRGPGCRLLEQSSYVEAVCRIGACLAEALQYAHDRGLLHLDVKPANVLIAADGTPMLLDFHLARPPLRAGAQPPPWLGGTPGYMAPELVAALEAVASGRPVPAAIDARTDVYALGVLLRAALGRGPKDSGRARCSPGLRDVLSRCTAADPADRYSVAADVAEDLRRHLADLPLKGVANRSLRERWGKWRRRRPYALPGGAVAVALGLIGCGLVVNARSQVGQAQTALAEGETHLDHGRFAEAAEALRGGELLASGVPFQGPLNRRLRDARQQAERGKAAAELHLLCEQVRPLYAAEAQSTASLQTIQASCRALWAKRETIAERLTGQSTPEFDRQWRADLLDLGVLSAHLEARLAAPGGQAAAHRRALAILAEAESLLGPGPVLYREREPHARALGQSDLADESARRADAVPPRTPWEHLVAGRACLGAGDLRRARAELERCLEHDPGSLWANYYRGACLLRLGNSGEAVAAFSACVALAPKNAWCFYNRGLAYGKANQLGEAREDFDRALALDPALVPAWLGRATVHSRSGHPSEALSDLRTAHSLGLPPAAFHYHTASVHLAAGNRASAVTALRDCLAHDPSHGNAQSLLGQLLAD